MVGWGLGGGWGGVEGEGVEGGWVGGRGVLVVCGFGVRF